MAQSSPTGRFGAAHVGSSTVIYGVRFTADAEFFARAINM